MNRKPAVSVLMPVHNGEVYLAEAVRSILGQTFSDFEFLIVDDGSTDGTPGILADFAAADARIRIHDQPHCGLVAALNRAVQIADGEFLARMDADDVAQPRRFERQVGYLRSHPQVAVLGTAMLAIAPDGRPLNQIRFPRSPADVRRGLERWCCLAHPTVIMRAEAVRAEGGYRAAYSDAAEDYDLWLRIAERYDLANLSDCLLNYRRHGTQLSARRRNSYALGKLAARAAAARRRQGLPDPTDGAAGLSPEVLGRLDIKADDVDEEVLRSQIAQAAGYVRFGQLDDALSALAEADALPCPAGARDDLRGEIVWNAAKIRLCRREWRKALSEFAALFGRHPGFTIRRAIGILARSLPRGSG
jgi:GT2 family glycosyltransferase